MCKVKSAPRSVEFYRKLGFKLGNTFTPDGSTEASWAWLHADAGAQLMVTRASEPVVASEQAVLFYLYCDDVARKRAELQAAGIDVGPMRFEFYAPRGEFQIEDPDGYLLMITHT
jgi:catechol 2,3-dioxygenase-like lactoylglutathione lyase family enzyme